jgi:hypothetical protein
MGVIAISINARSNKLVLTEDEYVTIRALTAEQLAEVEMMVRTRATQWLNALKQVREIVNGNH